MKIEIHLDSDNVPVDERRIFIEVFNGAVDDLEILHVFVVMLQDAMKELKRAPETYVEHDG